MENYKKDGSLIASVFLQFYDCKIGLHISLYLNAKMDELLQQRSNEFTIKKNEAHLPDDKKLPASIIRMF